MFQLILLPPFSPLWLGIVCTFVFDINTKSCAVPGQFLRGNNPTSKLFRADSALLKQVFSSCCNMTALEVKTKELDLKIRVLTSDVLALIVGNTFRAVNFPALSSMARVKCNQYQM